MTLRDGMVRVVGALSTADDVTPPCADASASWDVDDVAVLELYVLVASEVSVIDVLDGLHPQSQRKENQETTQEDLRSQS